MRDLLTDIQPTYFGRRLVFADYFNRAYDPEDAPVPGWLVERNSQAMSHRDLSPDDCDVEDRDEHEARIGGAPTDMLIEEHAELSQNYYNAVVKLVVAKDREDVQAAMQVARAARAARRAARIELAKLGIDTLNPKPERAEECEEIRIPLLWPM